MERNSVGAVGEFLTEPASTRSMPNWSGATSPTDHTDHGESGPAAVPGVVPEAL